MKKIYVSALIFLAVITRGDPVYSQICDSITPVFTVNLTGQPNGTWISPAIVRDGYCCGVSGSAACVEFIITLDPNATGINFNIASGAISGGSMFYQINCGPPTAVGSPICLSGTGPHLLTFCKPGNNTNTYAITSIPQPALNGTQWVSQACSGSMAATGLEDTSITWTSIPYNAIYNSYLSCTSGCNAVTVTPSGTLPAYVDYQVCGYVAGACLSAYFCDTIRINFVNNLAVAITPQNPVICFGGPNATVTANASGGLAPYNYLWNNGATTQSITVGAGTYIVGLQDSVSCSVTYDTVIVSALPSPISANAGADQLLCTNQLSVNLNGSIIAATGGIWLGGSGIFSPDNITLNATYTPSAGEIISGTVQLMLVTTGNSSCPADSDIIQITISPSPVPSISGNVNVCAYSGATYTAPLVSGINYNWTVSGGNVVSTNNNSMTVHWNAAGGGTITLTETNAAGCDSTITFPVTIHPKPVPVINGPPVVCTTTLSQFAVTNPVAGNTYSWSVTGGMISGSSNNSSVNIQWSTAGNATITVTQSNSFGCDSTVSIPVSILTIPTPVISGPLNVCEFQTMTYSASYVPGNTYNWSVTGGNIISNNTNSITVNWPAAGSGTVTLTQANTLVCDSTVTINVIIGPQPIPVINGPQTVCTTTISQYAVANPVAGNIYSWSVTSGMISGSSNNSSVNIQWSIAGSATISVTQSNSFGCDSTVSIPVTILTIPTPVISGPLNVCEFQTMTYSASYVPGNTYNWSVTGGNIISSNSNSVTVSWPSAGNGTVTLTQANTLVCDSTVTINVIIGPQPVPVINGPQSVCTTTISQYSVANPVAGNTYSWSVTGGMISGSSNNSNVNVQWFTAGNATITVTQSNSFGCDSTVSIPVTILTIPTPVISGPLNVCEFQTMTYTTSYALGNTYNWNVTGGTIIANNNNSITINWPSAGIGTVTVTQANTLVCDSTVTINVTIGPQPTPVINGPQSVCTTTISQYAVANPVAGNTYSWTVIGGMISGSSNNSNVNIQWSTAGNATVSITQSNSFGCDSTVSYPVTILTIPTPVISGSLNVCEFQTMTYSTPYVSGNTYNWNVTGGIIVSNNNNSITVNWPSAGNGTVTLTEANTLVCDSTVAVDIIIGPQPVPVINGPSSVCTTTISQYTVANPVAGNTYSWTVTGGIISGSSTNSNVNVQWSTAGNATISVTQANSFGCDSTVSYPVTILTMPTPVISGPLNVCAFQTMTYSTPYVSGNTYNWNVTGGIIVANNTNSITVNWPSAGNGTVTVTEANTLVCDSTVAINVIISPQPTPVINGSALICTATYAQYGVSPVAGDNYSWTISGGTIVGSSSTDNVTVIWTTSGTGMISVNQSNSFGCDSTVSYAVTVKLKPAPVLNGPPVNCVLDTSTYSVQNVIGDTYIWNVTGGSIVGLSVGSSIEVLWTTPGNGEVKLREITPDGCDSIVTKSVYINPLPQPVISGPMTVCEDEATFYNVAPVNNDLYNWSALGGSISGSTTSNAVQVTWPSAGVSTLTIIETTPQGCSVKATFQVLVNEKPHPSITGGGNVGCISNALVNYNSLLQPGINYQWTISGGNIMSGNGTSAIAIQWITPGYQTISITATNPLTGCDSTLVVYLNVDSLAKPVIQAAGLAGCVPVSLDFTGNLTIPGYQYLWSFGDGMSTYSANPYHEYTEPGTYSVQLIAMNNTGCRDTVYAQVVAHPNPVADFELRYGTPPYIIDLSTLEIKNHSIGATQYSWDFGDEHGSTLFEPHHKYKAPGTYTITLIATNQWGCSNTAEREIIVKFPEDIFIPNAFSPNNDHVNDYFKVSHNNITSLSISIFNRWGERIYISQDPSFKWDGTCNNKPVQEGVYVYAIQAKGYHGKIFNFSGNLTLIR